MGKPVKPSNLVGAVIRAVTRANAAVVYLGIQTFRIVIGRINWANWFARCIFTMLA